MPDKELLECFISEAFDLLDEIEPQLIELTDSGDTSKVDSETLNAIFRLFHTLKGGAGIAGLNTISTITHEAETLLDIFRNRQAALEMDHTLALCEIIDFLRVLLDMIASTGSDQGRDQEAQTVVRRLKDMISSCRGRRGDSKPSHQWKENGKITINLDDNGQDADLAGINKTHHSEEPSSTTISPAMRHSYVQEAEDLLDQAEESVMSIENTSDEDKTQGLDSAFRALHSLKGNSGFMGFPDVERLAHRMENTLDVMKRDIAQADENSIGILLKLIDMLRRAMGRIAEGDSGIIPGCDVYIDLLDNISSAHGHEADQEMNSHPEQPTGASSKPAKPVPPEQQFMPAMQIKQNIRVDIRKLNSLINLVGELVIAEAMVTRHPHVAQAEVESLDRAIHLLRRVSRDLQDISMSVRMVPLAATLRKMIRLVHDLGNKFNKKIRLKLIGEDTEVDKTVIEQIADPLVHIIRNAADHGIETPQERESAGKPQVATITIEGRHEGGEVWILISDDGKGMDRDLILSKAREKGLAGDEADEWTDSRLFRLIFEPGFSTAQNVSDVSGRGVGMDVVRKNIEKLKGKTDIQSIPGKGSTFILRIPLTLAIIDGMIVRVGKARYTIPLLAIRESLRPEPTWITETPDGQETVRIRDDFYPILRLHRRFNKAPDYKELHEGILVLVECDRRVIALFVDEILGRQETVIKGLSDYLGESPGISGCTILGDGEVSLILDVAGLVEERNVLTTM